MLLQTDNMNETISTIQSEKIDFTVDETALNHIMSVLTNLYSDPISSVVREITTNAFDSHLISGQTRPVEIFSPSRLSPNLVIQDFGAGMSANDIRELYSRYGASTKRGNNIEAGQLGLGSKSPFAYTDQFTIVAVKDGEKTTAILGRNSSGSAEINIVSISSTTDNNGVKMTIPVKSQDVYTFRTAIDQFVKYAEPGLVVVDSQPSTARDSWIDLGDGFFVTEEYGASHVVMGNVAYPIGSIPWSHGLSVIHYCEMGDVTFAPSREELIYNQQTKNKVQWIKDLSREKTAKYIEDQKAKAATTYDKVKTAIKFERWLPGGTSSTKNLPQSMVWSVTLPRYADSPASSKEINYTHLVRYERDMIVMRGFTSQRWTRLHSNKVLEENVSLAGKTILVYQDLDPATAKDLFGSNVQILDWDDFRSVKVARVKTEKRASFSFEGFSHKDRWGSVDIRPYEKIYYISKTSNNSSPFTSIHLKKNECVVFVPASGQEAFAKRFNAEPFVEAMRKRQERVAECLAGKKIQKKLAEANSSEAYYFDLLKFSDKITNEEFLSDARANAKYRKWERVARKWRLRVLPPINTEPEKYVLLRNQRFYNAHKMREHAIIYINALEEK